MPLWLMHSTSAIGSSSQNGWLWWSPRAKHGCAPAGSLALSTRQRGGNRRVRRGLVRLALEDHVRIHQDPAVVCDRDGVHAEREDAAGVAGVVALVIEGGAVEVAEEAPMLLLVGEQPVPVPAPAREGEEA